MYVYAITNRVNGQVYVGQHDGDLQRYLTLNGHRARSITRCNDKPLLYRAIRKHGVDSFVIHPLVQPVDKSQANQLERFFIRMLDVRNPEIGYNLAEGGDGGATRWGKHKPESIEKMRLAAQRPKSKMHKESLSISMSGRSCPGVVESNIRRRCDNPSASALRNRRYRARLKGIVNGVQPNNCSSAA